MRNFLLFGFCSVYPTRSSLVAKSRTGPPFVATGAVPLHRCSRDLDSFEPCQDRILHSGVVSEAIPHPATNHRGSRRNSVYSHTWLSDCLCPSVQLILGSAGYRCALPLSSWHCPHERGSDSTAAHIASVRSSQKKHLRAVSACMVCATTWSRPVHPPHQMRSPSSKFVSKQLRTVTPQSLASTGFGQLRLQPTHWSLSKSGTGCRYNCLATLHLGP